ncbi:DeoR/GlpR family DNA-binding transcription regulator [Haloferula chungangensis]|uniref:DeoR/GlpR family DNA-binding transcription regulator n=1 Tax=Haloferula chungangensis TaxID=1048331 RepID=A0ABW2L1U5_9BACT
MLPPERQSIILEHLAAQGSVRTIELASALEVTDETIRKDFEALEIRGKLQRIHGGAIKPDPSRVELTLTERQMVNRESKRAIARAAAERIQPNETIFIDASSTALTLIEFLPDFPITILTNAHNVVTALAGREGDIFCTGGLYEQRSRSYIGLSAAAALQKHNIHRMFFSGSAFDLDRGVSETNSRQASFKERVIAYSEEVCLLADSSKLGQRASFFFAQPMEISTLITNDDADGSFLQSAASLNIQVVQAPAL